MGGVALEVRGFVRGVLRRPTVFASLTLLLGLGVVSATSMFALADRFLWRPLPYPRPAEIVVFNVSSRSGVPFVRWSNDLPSVGDWRRGGFGLTEVGYLGQGQALTRLQGPRSVIAIRTVRASRSALHILGLPARNCTEADRCLFLSAGTSAKLFGGKDQASGRSLIGTDQKSIAVVGVLPPEFVVPGIPADGVFVASDNDDSRVRVAPSTVIARVDGAQNVTTVTAALQATLPSQFDLIIDAVQIQENLTRRQRSLAWFGLAMGLLLLLTCGSSLCNVLAARLRATLPELAVRRALGAGTLALVRLYAVEAAAVSLAGAIVGVLAAGPIVRLLSGAMPIIYRTLGAPSVGFREVVFAVLVSSTTYLLTGLAAAGFLREELRIGSAGSAIRTRVRIGRSVRIGTVAIQTAIAMAMAIVGSVLGLSYINLFTQDTGIDLSTTLASVSYPEAYTSKQIAAAAADTLANVEHVVGVESAAAVQGFLVQDVRTLGRCVFVDGQVVPADVKSVSAGFFKAVGRRMIAGRELSAEDGRGSGVVVSKSFATTAWPGQEAVGKSVKAGVTPGVVVGVFADIMGSSLDRPTGPSVYRLLDDPTVCTGCETVLTYVVRPRAGERWSPLSLADALGGQAGVVLDVSTLQERMTTSVKERVFVTFIVAHFSFVGIAMCVVGIVGVVLFAIAARSKELAIRVSLGAAPSMVIRDVSLEALVASALGVLSGVWAGHLAVRGVARFAYQVDAGSWVVSLVVGGGFLVAVWVLAVLAGRRVLRLQLRDLLARD